VELLEGAAALVETITK